jgi:predicted transcriptional regulator
MHGEQAELHKTTCQKMIRNLLDAYVVQHTKRLISGGTERVDRTIGAP